MTLEAKIHTQGAVFLDHSAGPLRGRRHLIFTDPVRVVVAFRVDDVLQVLDRVSRHVEAGGVAAGFLSYEAARAWIDVGQAKGAGDDTFPLAWFGLYAAPERPRAGDVEDLFTRMVGSETSSARLPRPVLTRPDAEYLHAVESVRELIREGDVYQVNYTGRFESEFSGDPLELYGRLRARQPVEYGAYIDCGNMQVLSLSPELFFRRRGRSIETRPMKGTAPRGRTPEEDAALMAWLRADPKSLAENLMIVDLLRNDLSVVCETGTVEVPDLYRVETYPTLHQMISRVTGRLRTDTGHTDLLRALFPCGSVTGAPKRRAMRRIRELEAEPRGVYCGAVGFVSQEESVFNVAIRTATVRGGRLRLGAGSGIVWESDPAEELAEARLKTRFFGGPDTGGPGGTGRPDDGGGALDPVRAVGSSRADGFSLIETMLADEGTVSLLDAHLDRVTASARAFGWSSDRAAIESALARKVAGLPAGRHRVRLLVGPEGVQSVVSEALDRARDTSTRTPFDAPPSVTRHPGPMRIGIARTEVHSANPFLRHKTTRRDVYERARREAMERGLEEVLLVNERGEITEGTTTNVFLSIDGAWFTPPPSAGLLPGVARAVFMDTVAARQRRLTPDDVRSADTIVLTNAVHGARRAELAT